MAKPDMGEMMGAMGEMPEASEEPAGPDSTGAKDDTGEVSDEEMSHAEDMGFDADQARALKRFIRSCMASEETGEYDEAPMPEEPAAPPAGMGEM